MERNKEIPATRGSTTLFSMQGYASLQVCRIDPPRAHRRIGIRERVRSSGVLLYRTGTQGSM